LGRRWVARGVTLEASNGHMAKVQIAKSDAEASAHLKVVPGPLSYLHLCIIALWPFHFLGSE